MSAGDAMRAGASQALLELLRSEYPDLTFRVVGLEPSSDDADSLDTGTTALGDDDRGEAAA